MEMLDNSITWFEIPVSDFDRAKKFYSAIYDYQMPETMVGPTRMGFFLYEQKEQRVGGAICFGKGYTPTTEGARVYLNGGSDLSMVLDRVEQAGGKVILPKTLIAPEHGYYALFHDTEGNLLALHSRK
ncbi:VOC family protein [Ohtaekwangia sp.]|uniref:VOC family protein n=1 Tax=Ohtaekwangia sp. TaxID=2066019 RepID=UPI002F955376